MSRFNQTVSTKTVNLAGGQSYTQSDKMQFASILLTSFLKDKFYESSNETIQRIDSLMNSIDPLFAAKAAVYARTVYGMRSVSHLVAARIARKVKGAEWSKNFFEKVVHRPDDMTEILSCYLQEKLPVPNALKKGFAKAFEKFSPYQLAKYRMEGKGVSLVDIVNLVHPKSSEGLAKLVRGELKSTDTWESKLTATKGDAEKKADAWKDLIKEKKIGYFALLRNLRNILQQAPELIDDACVLLTDENLIKKSLILPFRFSTAYQELKKESGASKILGAISKACDISCQNVPEFSGRTLVVLDSSGSMAGKPAEIGSLFSAVLLKSNPNADFMLFSDRAEYVSVNPHDSTLTIASSIPFRSGGTNFHSILQTANKAYDRMIILSDMQGWMGYHTPMAEYHAYCQRFNVKTKIYSFDLNGYGSLQFPEANIYAFAGWSEKCFDILKVLEEDPNALITHIESVQL